jgi:protein ImuB
MLRLLRAKLDDVDAGFGIDLMQLSAPVTEPLPPAQTSLPSKLDQTAGSKDREVLAALIDRLAGRLGPAGVLTLAPQESHLPERAETFVPALGATPGPAKDLLSSPKTTRRPLYC